MKCLTAACAGCGTCAGLCPANAIMLEKDELRIKDVAKPGKALLLYCENSGAASLTDTIIFPKDAVSGIEILHVPCGGLIDLDRLSGGLNVYKKVLAVVCPDDACRHFNGNKRACSQVKRLQGLLETAGLAAENVGVIQASHAMPKVILEELEHFII